MCLVLNFNNLATLEEYDRVYQTANFLTHCVKQANVNNYAFKKCLGILTEDALKNIQKHVENIDDIKPFV